MGWYEQRILPRLVDLTLNTRAFGPIRARVAGGLAGDVLEVGFGSGLNVPHYPAAVERVRVVEPATLGRVLAAERLAASPVPVEFIGLDGQELPLEPASIDHVLITWTMCTIPDISAALAEMRRVLRPGGTIHFAEHGRSPDAKVSAWQDRLTPIQRRVAGGCHLNRPIDELVRRAGFTIDVLDTYYLPGPKAFGYTYEGVASR